MDYLFPTPERKLKRQLDAHRAKALREIPNHHPLTAEEGEVWRDFMLTSRGGTGQLPNLPQNDEVARQRDEFLRSTAVADLLPSWPDDEAVRVPFLRRLHVSFEILSGELTGHLRFIGVRLHRALGNYVREVVYNEHFNRSLCTCL
jgi:hypothetical protein